VKRLQNAFRVLLVLMIGSLWSSGLIVAPTLFHLLTDRTLAGQLAGRIFSIETYLAVATAVFGLLLLGRAGLIPVYAAAALLALNEWGLRPYMALARLNGASLGLSFGAWHGVSALLYGIACAATLWLVWKNDFR
jgi:hypothetical protein